MTGYRSVAVRKLIQAIKDAGGEVSRLQGGRMRVTGPQGSTIISEKGFNEPKLVERVTGLKLEDG